MTQNIVSPNIIEWIFYGFGSLAIFSALMMILSSQIVNSVLFLVLTAFALAPIWIVLQAEFLAAILIIVYVGAVMVLFLFTVMMLDSRQATKEAGFVRFLPLGVGICILVSIGLADLLRDAFSIYTISVSSNIFGDMPTEALGELLFTEYVYAFEVAGVLLLGVMIAAMGLSVRGKRGRRIQSIQTQMQADPKRQIILRKDL